MATCVTDGALQCRGRRPVSSSPPGCRRVCRISPFFGDVSRGTSDRRAWVAEIWCDLFVGSGHGPAGNPRWRAASPLGALRRCGGWPASPSPARVSPISPCYPRSPQLFHVKHRHRRTWVAAIWCDSFVGVESRSHRRPLMASRSIDGALQYCGRWPVSRSPARFSPSLPCQSSLRRCFP